MKHPLRIALGVFLLGAMLSCSQPVTTREKGAGVGAVMGSGLGAGIGSIWGYAITGAQVGAGLGLVTGVLVGDHFQELEKKQSDLDWKIEQCERELQRLCDKLEKLKEEAEEE
jgi:outer membrane lipoprotein SlyB